MAESVASVTLAQAQDAVFRWLFQGGGGTYSGEASTAQKLQIDEIISRAYRQYMAPPILPGEKNAHVWSWIRPETTISVAKDPTGTTTTALTTDNALVDSAATFITAPLSTTASQSELVGRTVTVVVNKISVTNTILTVTNGTTLVMSTNWTTAQVASSTSSDTYAIAQDGDWNLPDDHGGIVGNLTFDATTNFPPVKQTSEARIRNLRQNSLIDQTQRPHLFSVRPRSFTPVAGGTDDIATTRWELMLWPRPDATYTFHYRYTKMFADIGQGDVTFNFPGGLRNAECFLAACLAMAERYADPTTPVSGKQWEFFIEAMRTAVSLDRQEMFADNLGPNLDRSDDVFHDHLNRFGGVTYLGVSYPT